MPTHQELATSMQKICARGVDPRAVLKDTEERIRRENAFRTARNCNPAWVKRGHAPRYEGPPTQQALEPVQRFGVATNAAWHACFAYASAAMRQEGIVIPTRALPRPFPQKIGPTPHELAVKKAAEVNEHRRRCGVAERIRERLYFQNQELFGNACLLEHAT